MDGTEICAEKEENHQDRTKKVKITLTGTTGMDRDKGNREESVLGPYQMRR